MPVAPSTPQAELGFEHVFEPGTDGRTLLLLHGTGGDEHDLVPMARRLAPRSALLSPRGKVLEQGMPRFFRRLAMGVLDIPDLFARADELVTWVDVAARQHGFDRMNVTAVGLSNGANIAAAVLLRRPGAVRGAALLRPMLPFEPEALVDLTGTRVLIAAGSHDPLVPPEGTARLAQLLAERRADVTVHTEPGGHGLTQGDAAVLADWLA